MISAVMSSWRTCRCGGSEQGELAVDLLARRGHRFDARFILGREGVQRGVAELRVHIIRRDIA